MAGELNHLTSQALRQAGIAFSQESDGTLRIKCPNPALGEVVVSFDDGEISVFLGDITHSHFTPIEARGKFPARTPEHAAGEVAQFLREVLADEWVIWRWKDGRGGCYKPGGDDWESANAPLPAEEVERFVWSGSFVPPDKLQERTDER